MLTWYDFFSDDLLSTWELTIVHISILGLALLPFLNVPGHHSDTYPEIALINDGGNDQAETENGRNKGKQGGNPVIANQVQGHEYA